MGDQVPLVDDLVYDVGLHKGEDSAFYLAKGYRVVAFCSELTALRAGLPFEPELDPDALDSFFVLGYFPGERTVFRGIRQLSPATLLRSSPASPPRRRPAA